MRGTPCIYQGSEIGMTNVAFDNPDDYKDVEAVNYFNKIRQEGSSMEEALHKMHIQGRDNVRTPVQWDDTDFAGFSKAEPWIKLNPNYTTINVANEAGKSDGILAYYKKMIAFRKSNKTLTYGDFESLTPNHETLYCYRRKMDDEEFIVCLNFSSKNTALPAMLSLENFDRVVGNVKHSSKSNLQPWEGSIYLKKASK
jgi:oligo-1,6-glucosidase